jgi:hypothetical protein
MDVKDLMDNVSELTDYEFENRLNKLVRDNSRYRNLDAKNREIVLDLVKKYKTHLRKGIGISYTNIRNESYKLYKNRLKLDLTEADLKDIKEILGMFKK